MRHRITLFLFAGAALFAACQNQQKTTATTVNPDWALLPFTKIDSVNPILKPGTGSFTDPILKKTVYWEEKDVFNPAIVNRDGKVYMLYRAQDKIGKPAGTSRIGLAVSSDAMHFTRMPKPVLYPDNDSLKKFEWQGGCEDPRVVRDDKGTYYMTYTAYDGDKARLFVATSTDLVHWQKHGNAFAKAYGGKYANAWAKSGSIVSDYQNGEPVATKINGKYWMYWGDKDIWAATSDDLVDWTPVEMQPGERAPVPLVGVAAQVPQLKIALPTRRGKFDSDLVESGPPAMLTDKGILLIYNSGNDPATGDKSLGKDSYAAGQALFDKNDPTKIVQRLDHWFMKPDKPYEITGQVNQVCFLEGLTRFNNKWYVYYGTADSKIAVAVCPDSLKK
ncbi:MAG TPA: glycoside hydrolase family 130 protein [Mucilaginibacter sp.]|nr:glycoside hydrolase family 130 protein [Mucilaginibacter sp.]